MKLAALSLLALGSTLAAASGALFDGTAHHDLAKRTMTWGSLNLTRDYHIKYKESHCQSKPTRPCIPRRRNGGEMLTLCPPLPLRTVPPRPRAGVAKNAEEDYTYGATEAFCREWHNVCVDYCESGDLDCHHVIDCRPEQTGP